MSELLELEPGSIVASQYGLVRQICQYLPGSSLRSCSNVNSLWAKAVDAEGKKRQISMFHWMGEAKSTRYYAQFGLQDSSNHESLYSTLEEWKKDKTVPWYKPKTSLTISIGDPMGGPGQVESFIADPFHVSRLLGTQNQNISIAASGMVIAPVNQAAQEIENISGSKETPVLASIVFPQLGPDIRITPFSYSELNFDTLLKNVQKEHSDITDVAFDQEVIKQVMGRQFDMQNIKCAVFMSNMQEIKQTSLFIQSLNRVSQKKMAIGGCIGNLAHDSFDNTFEDLNDMLKSFDRYTEDNPNKYAHTVGMIFAGANVQAASILLATKVNTKAKVEKELKKLKDLKWDETKSAAFMFACCGRGRHFYKGKAHVESEVFQRLFPKTPLIGIFGNGEIGLTFCPEESEDQTHEKEEEETGSAAKRSKTEVNRRLSLREFSHSFTTVFVLLSFD